jgi:hypothetical protein
MSKMVLNAMDLTAKSLKREARRQQIVDSSACSAITQSIDY